MNARLHAGAMTGRASLRLPPNPLGPWLNVEATLSEGEGLPKVQSLTVGSVPVPGVVADLALRRALAQWRQRDGQGNPVDALRRILMRDGALIVVYEWNEQLAGQLRQLIVPPEDVARLQAYQGRLVQIAGQDAGRPLPLERVLTGLLALAAERGGDAAAENRSALIALAFFVNGKGLEAVVPASAGWPRPAARHVTLGGRHDLAQHYSVSAALAAAAGSPLADAVGLYKEIDDARGGSGFSFNDIAADRAGTRFGEWAVGQASAGRAQARAGALAASDILPQVSDLPEYLQEAEFKRRFGGVGGAEYRRLMEVIEARVAQLPVLR